jgi:hypothetical protein
MDGKAKKNTGFKGEDAGGLRALTLAYLDALLNVGGGV